MSRNRFVVIRCSQPSKVPGEKSASDRNTRTNVSWVRSSASCALPESRYASRYTRAECSRTTCSQEGATQPSAESAGTAVLCGSGRTADAGTSPGSQTKPAGTAPTSWERAEPSRVRRTWHSTWEGRTGVPGHTGSQRTPSNAARCGVPSTPGPRRPTQGSRGGHYPRPVMSAEDPPGDGTAEGAAYADRFAAETPEMTAARDRAFHLPGSPPVEPAVGATMAVLAAGLDARSVVSIGSGGGLAGLWLMRGMRPDGVLTALDGDPEQLRAARKAFTEAGLAAGRARMIFGTPAEGPPRRPPPPPPPARRLCAWRAPPPAAGVLGTPDRPARPGAGGRHARLPRAA